MIKIKRLLIKILIINQRIINHLILKNLKLQRVVLKESKETQVLIRNSLRKKMKRIIKIKICYWMVNL